MRCAANLDLCSHVYTAEGACEDDPVDSVVTAMNTAAGVGSHCFDRDALVLSIDDMLSLTDTTDQESPLRMKEALF